MQKQTESEKSIFDRLPLPRRGIIGHRGASGLAPENTPAAFKAAAEQGLNWVEFDIRRCQSGEWIVIHDETLERTTDGHGRVSELPYSFLKTLDAGSWFNAKFSQERLPTLTETLSLLIHLNLHPNIEIKGTYSDPTSCMKDFLKVLHSAWPKTLALPLVSSFDHALLKILKTLQTDIPLAYVTKDFQESTLEIVKRDNFDTLHCRYRSLSPEKISLCHAAQIPVLVYTVNDHATIQSLLRAGVTAVFSDLTQ